MFLSQDLHSSLKKKKTLSVKMFAKFPNSPEWFHFALQRSQQEKVKFKSMLWGFSRLTFMSEKKLHFTLLICLLKDNLVCSRTHTQTHFGKTCTV